MITHTLADVIARDLRTLRREIEAYENEQDLWKIVPGVGNSAGTLAMHVAGNLSHFVGATLGATGYVRNREAEFSRRNVARADLLRRIDETIAAVEKTFARVGDEILHTTYPLDLGGTEVRSGDFLVHLATHLGYHLGQIDYHRRFVTGEAGNVKAVAISELRSARATS